MNKCFRHSYKDGRDHCMALTVIDQHCGTPACKWFRTLEEELAEEDMCRKRCADIGVKYSAPSEGVIR